MTDEIRRAMDARLSVLEGSPELRARIRARIVRQSEEEEPKVKRKVSVGLVVAIVLLVAFGGIAVAEMAGFNVFGYFAQSDQSRYALSADWERVQKTLTSLQEKGTLISTSYTQLHDEVREGYVEIHDAYYDGDVLFLSEIIRDPREFAIEWTPTEEELEAMKSEPWEKIPNARTVIMFAHNEEEEEVYAAYNEALQEWRPFGLKRYVYCGEGNPYQTLEGSELRHEGLYDSEWINGEATYVVAEMQVPLPEEIRQQDAIQLQFPLEFYVEYNWFDGARLYCMSEHIDGGMMTVTIGRDPDTRQRSYQSEPIEIDGVAVQVGATASPYLAHVTLRAEEPIFPLQFTADGDEIDPWYIVGYNEKGEQLGYTFPETHVSYGDNKSPQREVIRFYERNSEDGLTYETYLHLPGEIPEALTITINGSGMGPMTVELNPVD